MVKLVTLSPDNFSGHNLEIDGSMRNYIMLYMSRLQSILNEYLPSELNIVSGFSIHLSAQTLCCEVVKKQSIE